MSHLFKCHCEDWRKQIIKCHRTTIQEDLEESKNSKEKTILIPVPSILMYSNFLVSHYIKCQFKFRIELN